MDEVDSSELDAAIERWREGPRGGQTPTINDIASIAVVSKKTVSRVINGGMAVRPGTKARIDYIIQQLDFVPNPQARGLATSFNHLIGFIYDNPNPEYVVTFQQGILDGLKDTGFELAVHQCDCADPELSRSIENFVKRQRLFGVVVTPSASEDTRIAEAIERTDTQLVRVASVPLNSAEFSIVTNDREGAALAGDYLISLGHRRIAHVSGSKGFCSASERLEGFKGALQKHGLNLPRELIFDGDYTFDSGVLAGQRLLSSSNPPTAVFAANDEMAAGLLEALRQRNMRAPHDLSVIGYDDFQTAQKTYPKLTTIHAPTVEAARHSVGCLLGKPEETTISRPWLVVRESTISVP